MFYLFKFFEYLYFCELIMSLFQLYCIKVKLRFTSLLIIMYTNIRHNLIKNTVDLHSQSDAFSIPPIAHAWY